MEGSNYNLAATWYQHGPRPLRLHAFDLLWPTNVMSWENCPGEENHIWTARCCRGAASVLRLSCVPAQELPSFAHSWRRSPCQDPTTAGQSPTRLGLALDSLLKPAMPVSPPPPHLPVSFCFCHWVIGAFLPVQHISFNADLLTTALFFS